MEHIIAKQNIENIILMVSAICWYFFCKMFMEKWGGYYRSIRSKKNRTYSKILLSLE